ncbi:MAG: DNA-binding protein [Firmicutes bacterium]|nr:DNA-binding protein [Bacillota bacterium]
MSFDKNGFARLLKTAKGNRSINKYAGDSGVTSAHISRLLREKIDTPPNPDTIKKLAEAAGNNVTYEELMVAAGHIVPPSEPPDSNENIDLVDLIKSNSIILTIYGRPLTGEQKDGLIKYIESGRKNTELKGNHGNDSFAAHDEEEEVLVLKPDLAALVKASQKVNEMLQKFLEEKQKAGSKN